LASVPHILLNPPPLASRQEMVEYAESEMSRAAYRALVVGGEASFVTRKLAPRLRRHLIRMVAHWPWKKANGTFPEDIDLLFVLTDMVSHSMSGVAIKEAQRRGIPVVMGVRKHTMNLERLAVAGFPEFAPFATHPVDAGKLPKYLVAAVEDRDEIGSMRRKDTKPAPVMIETPKPKPESTPSEEHSTPMPAPAVKPVPESPSSLQHALDGIALRLLSENPGLTNKAIGVKMDGATKTQATTACSRARARLGIRFVPGTIGTGVPVDAAKYEATCAEVGVPPVKLSAEGTFPRSDGGTAASARPLKTALPRQRPRAAAVVPIVATVPASEVPAEVRSAYEHAEATRRSEPATTIEALRLLLEAMRAEGVATVTVNEDGSVSMQRRMVVTSTLAL